MSFSNISELLDVDLNNNNNQNHNQNNGLNKYQKSLSGLALSNTSELEIKNLLRQVDQMIHYKKLRWERHKQEMDDKLQAKEQESTKCRLALEKKNAEVKN